jgi:hypothetical protein
MTQEHPITPPPELIQQWWDGTHGAFYEFEAVATQAARWGADQELEACCEWLVNEGHEYEHVALRDARRPKPSLKKQALETLCSMQIDPCWINGINTNADLMSKYDIIRRALEQLDD